MLLLLVWCGAEGEVHCLLADAFALIFAILVDTWCWPPGQLSSTGDVSVALSI